MGIFGKKKNMEAELLKKIIEVMAFINHNKLEIVYYSNENITLVASGKIKRQVGWIVKLHGEKLSGVSIDKQIYDSYSDVLMAIGDKRWQA